MGENISNFTELNKRLAELDISRKWGKGII